MQPAALPLPSKFVEAGISMSHAKAQADLHGIVGYLITHALNR